jgi:hypothetical protein
MEVCRACETYSRRKNCMQAFSRLSELKTILENVGADGKDNIKIDLQ